MMVMQWKEVPAQYESQWAFLFNENRCILHLETPCPICGTRTLRRYYDLNKAEPIVLSGNAFVGRGGLWEWCGTCGHYAHYSAAVPACWKDSLPVETSQLSAVPDEIERVLRESENNA